MTDAWKDNHCWVSAPPSLVRDRFLLLATFLQRQIKISANQMKGEGKFFSYLGLLLHLATTSQLQISANHMKGMANVSLYFIKNELLLFLFPTISFLDTR